MNIYWVLSDTVTRCGIQRKRRNHALPRGAYSLLWLIIHIINLVCLSLNFDIEFKCSSFHLGVVFQVVDIDINMIMEQRCSHNWYNLGLSINLYMHMCLYVCEVFSSKKMIFAFFQIFFSSAFLFLSSCNFVSLWSDAVCRENLLKWKEDNKISRNLFLEGAWDCS